MTRARGMTAAGISAGFLIVAAAREAPPPAPAADPRVVELIHELALPEASVALREQPGWKEPGAASSASGRNRATGPPSFSP